MNSASWPIWLRFTHRTALGHSRLIDLSDDEVASSYKDCRQRRRHSVMGLALHEFVRRFLLHVLRESFQRIRHYGLLANGDRGDSLPHRGWRTPRRQIS